MQIETHWHQIKTIFNHSFASSLHYAIATVDEHGGPHVTPIGSLLLGAPGQAIYFEEFPSRLPKNIDKDPRVSILAVNSSKWFWLKSLYWGKFNELPSVRLIGTAGARREATDIEIKRWHNRTKITRYTKGFNFLWKNMKYVRELNFHKALPIKLGQMTNHLDQH